MVLSIDGNIEQVGEGQVEWRMCQHVFGEQSKLLSCHAKGGSTHTYVKLQSTCASTSTQAQISLLARFNLEKIWQQKGGKRTENRTTSVPPQGLLPARSIPTSQGFAHPICATQACYQCMLLLPCACVGYNVQCLASTLKKQCSKRSVAPNSVYLIILQIQTAFYLPLDTNRLVHIQNITTTKEVSLLIIIHTVSCAFNVSIPIQKLIPTVCLVILNHTGSYRQTVNFKNE